ncbi:MAG: dipeptidyl aminopeptidase, partial [Pseudonocardia sp.]|nr:dipeptidyl aminopeptidase [Pseudonocardia sp.]
MTTFMADPTFDDQFGRTLTAAVRGCGDIGEALAVATHITSGDVTSWATAWSAKADAVLAEADASHEAGDVVGARRAYLRACEYYRQAFFFARTDLDDPVLRSAYA